MKKIVFALLISTCWLVSSAQSGFNKKYDLSLPATLFRNLMLDGDTLVLFGIGIQPNSTQQGIIFAKMDTLGNLAQTKIILNDSGKPFTVGLNYSIAKTLDDASYVVVGESSPFAGILLKLNKNGDLVLYKEHIDSSVLVVFQRKVIELKNGFFISGFKQKNDFFIDVFLMKTDSDGNKLWEKSYGLPNIDDFQNSFYKLNDNCFVLGCSHQHFKNVPVPDRWAHSWIFAIDSLGEVLWEFEGEKNTDIGVAGLNQTSDGGWIYCSGTYEVFSANDWGSRCQIVRRDSNFNLLWTQILSETSYSTNSMVDMKPMPDGTWAAVGRWSTPIISGQSNYLGGSVHRLNDSGDTLWSKLFTAFPASPNGSENYLGGLAVLPSGSIVAAGYTRRFAPPITQYYGWVIKVTADGCIDTLCVTSSISVPVEEKAEVAVYPNPANEEVMFDLRTMPTNKTDVAIFDVVGHLVWTSHQSKDILTWQTNGCPAGIYFYQISVDGKTIQSGKIMLQK